jgi:hypothetical protein
MALGILTAHYGVEGDGFYGFPLSEWLPYSVTRTWHIQIGLFWIATAWLAAGLFIGPLVSEQEPAGQRLGVNVLFVALLVIVVGSLTGEWLSIQNKMTDTVSFYLGHQGYELCRAGTCLANRIVCRPADLVLPDDASSRSGLAEKGRSETARRVVGRVDGRDRSILRGGADLGTPHSPHDR